MSALNLIAALLCPEYPAMFLVESPDMVEARRMYGYQYENFVGSLLGTTAMRQRLEAADRETDDTQLVHEASPVHDETPLPTTDGLNDIQQRPAPESIDSTTESQQQVVAESSNEPPSRDARPEGQEIDVEKQQEAAARPCSGPHHDQASKPQGRPSPIFCCRLSHLRHLILVIKERRRAGDTYKSLVTKLVKALVNEFRDVANGEVERLYSQYIRNIHNSKVMTVRFVLLLVFVSIPFAVIGGLTSFDAGSSSTHAQRVWTMTWLTFGATLGTTGIPPDVMVIPTSAFLFVGLMIYSAPAVGGLVVVGQMLSSYGTCVKVL